MNEFKWGHKMKSDDQETRIAFYLRYFFVKLLVPSTNNRC